MSEIELAWPPAEELDPDGIWLGSSYGLSRLPLPPRHYRRVNRKTHLAHNRGAWSIGIGLITHSEYIEAHRLTMLYAAAAKKARQQLERAAAAAAGLPA